MLTHTIDWHDKALWQVGPALTVEKYVAEGHSLFDGSISWPAMVLRESALAANLETLAAFCRRHDLDFAPHGKTSMSPTLFQRQIDAGAWGITVATAHQARIAFGYGVQRVLLANQLLDAAALDAIAALLLDDTEREFYCLVDSAEGVKAIADAGARHPQLVRGLAVLIDIGWSGGRTGVRSADEALELARLVAATENISLAGVSSYEGGLGDLDQVRAHFGSVRDALERMSSERLVSQRPVVTAGGSAYFDQVASDLGPWARGLGVQLILRSGAYVSHDHGLYHESTPFNRVPEEGHLDAAIEVWAQIGSAPEPGLAIAVMGRRDAPYDSGMPVPLRLRRAGGSAQEGIDGRAEVTRMDDQHAYLCLANGFQMRPGDLVCFGISHPCTAFDKWRVIPVLDDDDRVLDLLRTYF